MIKETRIQNFCKRKEWIDNMIIQNPGENMIIQNPGERYKSVNYKIQLCSLKIHNKMLDKIIIVKTV